MCPNPQCIEDRHNTFLPKSLILQPRAEVSPTYPILSPEEADPGTGQGAAQYTAEQGREIKARYCWLSAAVHGAADAQKLYLAYSAITAD